MVPERGFGQEVEGFLAVVGDADDAAQVAELLGEDALVDEVVFDDEHVQGFGDGLLGRLGGLRTGFLGTVGQHGVRVNGVEWGLYAVCGWPSDSRVRSFGDTEVVGSEGA